MAFFFSYFLRGLVKGGGHKDFVFSFHANSIIFGGWGDNYLNGGSGNDKLFGGRGDDTLNGYSGNDMLFGGRGNDTVIYDAYENIGNRDFAHGGSGADTLVIYLTQDFYAQHLSDDIKAQYTSIEAYADAVTNHFNDYSSAHGKSVKFHQFEFNLRVKKFENITVDIVNTPPVAVDDTATTNEDSSAIQINLTGNDEDLDPTNDLEISSIDTNGTVGIVSINPDNDTVSYNPNGQFEALAQGAFMIDTFSYTVSDGNGGFDTASVAVTINGVNDAPILDPIGGQMVDQSTELTFTATASDVDSAAATLDFSLLGAPAGASIDEDSGAFTWTPQAAGDFTFDVVVGDGMDTDSETITVTVNEDSASPVLTVATNHTLDEETTLTFTATASDADSPPDSLAFSLVGAPAGANIDKVSGVFTWIPSEAQGPDSFVFDVVVTDGENSDTETVTVDVNEVNVAPVLDPIFNGETVDINALDFFSFTASASDPDIPNNLTFSLAQGLFSISPPPIGAVIDPQTGVFSWTPTVGQGLDEYSFDVVVDDGMATDRESITIQVGAADDALL